MHARAHDTVNIVRMTRESRSNCAANLEITRARVAIVRRSGFSNALRSRLIKGVVVVVAAAPALPQRLELACRGNCAVKLFSVVVRSF